MYKFTDKMVKSLIRQSQQAFNSAKASILTFDEINVMVTINRLYAQLTDIAKAVYLAIAKDAYKKAADEEVEEITELWLLDFLNRYDPVTGYKFNTGVEVRSKWLAENVVGRQTKNEPFKKALNTWALMATQFAIEITDEATIKAYEDKGITRVQWITEQDSRRCKECERRHGRVYNIGKIPPKPHINCRCYLIPYRGK